MNLPPSKLTRCHGCACFILNREAVVWWGTCGPFHSIDCREAWIAKANGYVQRVREMVTGDTSPAPPAGPRTIDQENAARHLHACVQALSRTGEEVIRLAGELREVYGRDGMELDAALARHKSARENLDRAIAHARKVGLP
jgi:hypothetical protein